MENISKFFARFSMLMMLGGFAALFVGTAIFVPPSISRDVLFLFGGAEVGFFWFEVMRHLGRPSGPILSEEQRAHIRSQLDEQFKRMTAEIATQHGFNVEDMNDTEDGHGMTLSLGKKKNLMVN